MKNRSLALSAALAATLICLSPLHAANYLGSLARLHQNFVQLTDILSAQEAPSSEAAIADLERQFRAQELAKTQSTRTQQQIREKEQEAADLKLALELSLQEQTAREKKAQEQKEQKEKKRATSTVILASVQAKITDETKKAWPPLTGGPRPTFPVGSVWAIQGRSKEIGLDRATWTKMDDAIKQHDLKTVVQLLPQFGYYPGGALMGRQQRPLGEVAVYHLKQAPSNNDAQKINLMINAIQFYETGEPFYEFANLFKSPINLDGVTWGSTEAYFQAQKFNWNNKAAQARYNEIKNNKNERMASGMAAFGLSKIQGRRTREYLSDPRAEEMKAWQARSLDVMRQALEAKFTQHAELKKLLLSTGDLFIIEASPKDAFWGTHTNPCTEEQQKRSDQGLPPLKCDGTGDNWLGRLLVETREKIRSGQI